MTDLDPTLDQQLLNIAIREVGAQIPADRDHDHLGREPEPGERRRPPAPSVPKSRAGVRTVPLPALPVAELRALLPAENVTPDPRALVFHDRVGHPLRRTNFRRRVWLPSLVRAGLLGRVFNTGPHRYPALWPDRDGVEWSAEFTTEREAVAFVAAKAAGGMRFHDLRHAYAAWLVADGVPVNLVQGTFGPRAGVNDAQSSYVHPGRLRGPRLGGL